MPDQPLGERAACALEPVFARLGELLADLHGRRPSPAVARPLLRSHPGVDVVRHLLYRGRERIPPTLSLERLQEQLLCEHPDLAHVLRQACLTWDRCAASSVVHGAFSPAYIVLAEGCPRADGLRVLGWYDAAFGPAAADAGWLLGELRELAETRDAAGAALLRHLGRALLTAYAGVRHDARDAAFLDECSAFAAVKIVAHLAAFVRGYGFDADAVAAQLRVAAAVAENGWEPAVR